MNKQEPPEQLTAEALLSMDDATLLDSAGKDDTTKAKTIRGLIQSLEKSSYSLHVANTHLDKQEKILRNCPSCNRALKGQLIIRGS